VSCVGKGVRMFLKE